MEIILSILITALVAIAVVLLAKVRTMRNASQEDKRHIDQLMIDISEADDRKEQLTVLLNTAANDSERARSEAATVLAQAQAENTILRDRLESQAAEREKIQEQFTHQFQNLANTILEDKSRRFTETNNRNIGELLRPLGENIEKFRQRIEQESTQRQILEKEIARLHQLSNQVSDQANNLASALRGNSKVQGDWGEMVLETLLESSGLQKGVHFTLQESFKGDDGRTVRPDVVLTLPDSKQMIIDSKVSLTAYATYAESEQGEPQQAALAAHILSIRSHINELGAKNYQKLTNSPDFVIMFIPTEPALLLALQHDPKLWGDAYSKKVILSSPTNLFAILKIVDDLWRRDSQDRYALEIANQGGMLYDKFVGFADTFLTIGDALGRTDRAYSVALGQLRDGNGSLISRTERLRKLGVKASKKMSPALAQPQDDDDDETTTNVTVSTNAETE